MSDIRNEVKSVIAREGFTMQQVVDAINKKYNKKDTIQNLSAKLTRGTIKYSEIKEIADVLGYDMIWRDRDITRHWND